MPLHSRIFSLIVMTLAWAIPNSSYAWGGRYVPPTGTDLSRWVVPLQVDCSNSRDPKVSTWGGAGNALINTNPVLAGDRGPSHSIGSIDILAVNKDLSRFEMLKVDANHQISIRTDANSAWLNIGQISNPDVDKYCADLKQWESQAKPISNDPPRSLFALTLSPGVAFSVSRDTEITFCIPNIETGDYSRNLDYSTKVTDPSGNSETFETVVEVFFGDRSACANWSEAPWVSQ